MMDKRTDALTEEKSVEDSPGICQCSVGAHLSSVCERLWCVCVLSSNTGTLCVFVCVQACALSCPEWCAQQLCLAAH